MISTWSGLLLVTVGALAVEHQYMGELPHPTNLRPTLDIINGTKTSVEKYPFISSISLLVVYYQYGAAAILNERWLLTSAVAASWLPVSAYKLRVGSDYYYEEGQLLNADNVIVHPNFTFSYDWNIALIKTDKPIKFGKNVKPVKLGTEKLVGGTKASVAGWGVYNSNATRSKHLREAQVTVYDWKKCEDVYKGNLTDRMLCTFDEHVAPSTYDYGDPLVENGVLYGLYSGAYSTIPGQSPILYTDVTSYHEWIQSTIKNNEDYQTNHIF